MLKYRWRDKLPSSMMQRSLLSWWSLHVVEHLIPSYHVYKEFIKRWRWFGLAEANNWGIKYIPLIKGLNKWKNILSL